MDYKVIVDFHSTSGSPMHDAYIKEFIVSFLTLVRNGQMVGNGSYELPVSQELVLALFLIGLAKEETETRRRIKFYIRSDAGHIRETPNKDLEAHFPGLLKEATTKPL
jgi:hypothetical protein